MLNWNQKKTMKHVLTIGIIYFTTGLIDFIILCMLLAKSSKILSKANSLRTTNDVQQVLIGLAIAASISIVLSDALVSTSYFLFFSYNEESAMYELCLVLYYTGKVLLIMFLVVWMVSFVLRLYSTFEGTTYSINRSTLYSMFVVIVIATINMLCSLFLSQFLLFINAVSGVLFIIEIIWITVLFAKKLLAIIISIRTSIHLNLSDSNSNHDTLPRTKSTQASLIEQETDDIHVSISQSQHQLIGVIAKQTLIAFIQAITIILWALGVLVTELVGIKTVYDVSSDSTLTVTSYCIFHVASVLLLFLSFAFAQKEFDIICGRCNNICLDLCEMTAIKNIEKQSEADIAEKIQMSYKLMDGEQSR